MLDVTAELFNREHGAELIKALRVRQFEPVLTELR